MEGEEMVKATSKRWIVMPVFLAFLLIAAVGYLLTARNVGGNVGLSNGNGQVSNVASVATVNGVAIPKTVFDSQLASAIDTYKTQGVDVNAPDKLAQVKTQVIDSLINNELLSQGIMASGIKPTPEDVEKQFQLTQTQVGGADALKALLAKNNINEAQLRENIFKQLSLEAYLGQNVDVKSVTVSNAEIDQFYADYVKVQKASGAKTIPAIKDLSEQIKQQILTNKRQLLVTQFVSSLRAKAKIEIAAN